MNLHAIRELEGLEVGVGQDGSTGTKVLNLRELGHELGSGDTALLVNQLNGSAFSIVSHAVTDQHVKLLIIVLDGQDHGHGLTDLHKARNFRGPWTFADLKCLRCDVW